MKHLKRFENFYLDLDEEQEEMDEIRPNDKSDCETCDDDDKSVFDFEDDFEDYEDENTLSHWNSYKKMISSDLDDNEQIYDEDEEWGDESEIPNDSPDFDNYNMNKYESKKTKAVSYKKSGLKNPKLADRNKNKKIEGWERAIAKKIEAQIEKRKKKN
jgi:hypothetical protein